MYLSLCRTWTAALVGLLFCVSTTFAMPVPRPGQVAPDFQVNAVGGQPVSLSALRGKVVIIDFFATWCKPCQQSIPFLIRLDRTFGPSGLEVIGLSMDADKGQVTRFMETYRTTYTVAMGSEMVRGQYGARYLPTIYVVDRKGLMREQFMGFSDETARAMENLVKKLLAEK